MIGMESGTASARSILMLVSKTDRQSQLQVLDKIHYQITRSWFP